MMIRTILSRHVLLYIHVSITVYITDSGILYYLIHFQLNTKLFMLYIIIIFYINYESSYFINDAGDKEIVR